MALDKETKPNFEEYIKYLWESGFLDDFQYSQENLVEVKIYQALTKYFK